MNRSNRELWLALFAMLLITLVYVLISAYLNEIPAASDFFGHSIGKCINKPNYSVFNCLAETKFFSCNEPDFV